MKDDVYDNLRKAAETAAPETFTEFEIVKSPLEDFAAEKIKDCRTHNHKENIDGTLSSGESVTEENVPKKKVRQNSGGTVKKRDKNVLNNFIFQIAVTVIAGIILFLFTHWLTPFL